jgi:hypothetical protein
MIENGYINLPGSWFSYPEMAVNNTYDIRAVNDSILAQMREALHREGGCLHQAYQRGNLSCVRPECLRHHLADHSLPRASSSRKPSSNSLTSKKPSACA